MARFKKIAHVDTEGFYKSGDDGIGLFAAHHVHGVMGFNDGLPLEPEWIPTKIFKSTRHPIKDVMAMTETFAVSERCRVLIEALEPGRHQFFPVDVLVGKNTPFGKAYLLNVCNRISYIDVERERMRGNLMEYSRGRWRLDRALASPPVYLASARQGLTLWRDRYTPRMSIWGMFVSDEFASRFQDAGMTGVVFESVTTEV